ncbi:hypothetical protein FACS1894168_0120 [Deltaproteobacteria bacterium]|nr:hypothetical protein FACS1894168_0120 [Deltaproteobacteria bacterium]
MFRACDDPRLLDSLRHNCGPLIMNAIEDEEVVEIMLNPDGSLWIERYGQDHEHIGDISPAQGRLILSLTASGLDLTVNDRSPIVEGEFPLDGSRFEGTFPPIVGPGPSFSLRKKASRVFTLAEYLAAGSITQEIISIIHEAVLRRLNIVVVGGTSSGKTTFVNAVIHAVSELTPSHRLLILEDTAELQSKSPNTVFFRTSVLANVDMRALAKTSMRYAPKRIIVGEVRDAAALELLKLWNTGQTAQQIRMVQQNVERYQNMLQNTMRLPETLLIELKGSLTRLAHLSGNLKTLRGDVVSLGQIFSNLFPEQSLFGDLAGASPEQVAQANARYEAEWDKWAASVDQASQATFQLSGQQLADLQQDPEQFQSYIDNLLSTPEGQQQALMAGNQLAAIQVQEARQLRELIATQAQSALTSQMKAEKESQMQQEAWRDTLKTNKIGKAQAKPDPF